MGGVKGLYEGRMGMRSSMFFPTATVNLATTVFTDFFLLMITLETQKQAIGSIKRQENKKG